VRIGSPKELKVCQVADHDRLVDHGKPVGTMRGEAQRC
jgi:hypothetical protein